MLIHLLEYNYIILFFVILITILMSKYILNKTNTEMFEILNKSNKSKYIYLQIYLVVDPSP